MPLRPADVLMMATLCGVAAAGQFPPQWTGWLPAGPAHFAGFMALGAAGASWFNRRLTPSVPWAGAISWLACVALGALDEWRQLLISGRHGDTGDLLVDCLGAAAGVVCAGVFQWIMRRRVENEPAD